MSLRLRPTFRDDLAAASRPLVGMWVCSGSSVVAEIAAGSGLDWLLVDMEHTPNSPADVLVQLQAIAAYPITPVVRVAWNDAVLTKQVLDTGAQNLLIPMVNSAEEAAAAVAAVRYPPYGTRGIGSALARSGRWNREVGYLANGNDHVSLYVQVETTEAVEHAAEIAAVEGVDGIFVGPSDLSASMGLIGQQTHPEVLAAVHRTFEAAHAAGKPVGVNAFDPARARDYLDEGADFILVGADVTLLARGSERLASEFIPG